MYRTYGSRATQEQLPRSYAEEQKPAMRVMVVDRCSQFMSLTFSGTAVKADPELYLMKLPVIELYPPAHTPTHINRNY